MAIEMDELPACDLPIEAREGAVYGMARSMPRYRRATFPRAEDACLISWTLELSANYGFFPGG